MSDIFSNNKPRESAIGIKLTRESLNRSILNIGDNNRLARVIRKAMNGEDIVIGAIGGSITAGNAATVGNSYVQCFVRWWEENFPKCKIEFKNAGIGATDSLLAVHRVEKDILQYKPDLVVIDFSFNDNDPDNMDLYSKSYEDLIRRIILMDNTTALILLFMCDQDGWNMRDTHLPIGLHYNLPIISYRDAIISEKGEWLYEWPNLSPDNIHPNNLGHKIISELLINYVECIYKNIELVDIAITEVPKALYSEVFSKGFLYTNQNLAALELGDFYIDNNAFWQFHNGWTSNGGERSLVFNITAKNILFYYKKDIQHTAGKFEVLLDGVSLYTIDTEFKDGWGDYVKIHRILLSDIEKEHIVEFKPVVSGEKKNITVLGLLLS